MATGPSFSLSSGPSLSPPLPPAIPRGGDGPQAHSSLYPSPERYPPHWCWPAPCSPCFSACRFLHVTVAISACRSLCYLSGHLPACVFICQPVRQLCSPGLSATCHAAPPVFFLPSVCPRPAADTAFNSVPARAIYGLREGDKVDMGRDTL